jgi:hypothetical protein
VSAAGDVNNDGYDDVVVGAWLYDAGQTDEGRVYVFLGSSTGITTPAVVVLEGNQEFAHFGNSAAGAGDVNADGYDDIVVALIDSMADYQTRAKYWFIMALQPG